MADYVYYGNGQRRFEAVEGAWNEPEPYLPDAGLVQAVNLAIFLRRPLLLEGEPGCGKSRLAYSVAYELGLPLFRWEIRSTDRAQDGLYTFDGLRRLYDAQANVEGATNPTNYIDFGAIGNAFIKRGHPSVVLIDEIDKADLDFPNDLLNVLDKPHSFNIKELGNHEGAWVRADAENLPIVIITSNKEKGNLPAPFLRRCIYHFVRFPSDPDRLRQIIEAHTQQRNQPPPEANLLHDAIDQFNELRDEGNLARKPGTSELLDWVHVLTAFKGSGYDIVPENADLPYRGLLLKLQSDWQKYGSEAS